MQFSCFWNDVKFSILTSILWYKDDKNNHSSWNPETYMQKLLRYWHKVYVNIKGFLGNLSWWLLWFDRLSLFPCPQNMVIWLVRCETATVVCHSKSILNSSQWPRGNVWLQCLVVACPTGTLSSRCNVQC